MTYKKNNEYIGWYVGKKLGKRKMGKCSGTNGVIGCECDERLWGGKWGRTCTKTNRGQSGCNINHIDEEKLMVIG